MRNPFRVETTVEYRSPLPLSAFHSETGPLYALTIPNDCIVDLVDESGHTIQRLYGRMAFDSLPRAKARVQARAGDGGTEVSVTYVMPFLKALYPRVMQFLCTIGGGVLLLEWVWVIRHDWSNVRSDIRPVLIMGTVLWVGFSLGAFSQLRLSDYPSVLSAWLEDVGKLERVPEPTK